MQGSLIDVGIKSRRLLDTEKLIISRKGDPSSSVIVALSANPIGVTPLKSDLSQKFLVYNIGYYIDRVLNDYLYSSRRSMDGHSAIYTSPYLVRSCHDRSETQSISVATPLSRLFR